MWLANAPISFANDHQHVILIADVFDDFWDRRLVSKPYRRAP
jgi:hypothetical protein